MHSIRTLAAATSVALALAACGGSDGGSSDDGGDPTDRIAALFEEAGAPEDEARCVAEQLDDDITPDQVEDYIAAVFTSEDAADLEAADTDVAIAVGLAVNECGV